MSDPGNRTLLSKEDVAKCLTTFGRAHPEIVRLELFGSVARGESSAASDVDLMVTFTPVWKQSIDTFDYSGYLDALELKLAEVLGRSAHLTDHAGVQSSVRIGNMALARAIARDGQLVYEADQSMEGCFGSHHRELPQSSGTRR